jgi:hypothetical protein
VKRYEKYGRKINWIEKWFGKYRRKVIRIVKRYGKYGRKVGWIVKYGKYGRNKGNNKITELRTILQRESQNS